LQKAIQHNIKAHLEQGVPRRSLEKNQHLYFNISYTIFATQEQLIADVKLGPAVLSILEV